MGLSDFFKKGKEEPIKPAPAKAPQQPVAAPAPQPAPAAAAPQQDVYTVASGDSLSKIAKKFYGDAGSWKKIYEANKATIGSNPDLIKPGQQFVIPR
ncbi:LysM peptidoglycan-binding domain-containing protein [Pontibacter qinzhouensis]|uniref:LysM peptidoglycan-binding domain-containing protein n=1 Tax=Pontibacter qinzhouensis TaxID=2603253 RepID=A0A5C8K8B0_9BACT|nr:LysM peptidoglycan-binding domain-containing protein [Pontibacter qinzhouensis]TXK46457.1 LysM peptidoglycan-binding domain-containing protein [Pontibacter qinzhouensis]